MNEIELNDWYFDYFYNFICIQTLRFDHDKNMIKTDILNPYYRFANAFFYAYKESLLK